MNGRGLIRQTGFNIQPNLDLVAVPGRVLPVPRICYKDSKMKGKEIQPQFGGWNMKEIRFSQATQLPSWTWIYIDAPRARQPFTGPDDLNGCLQRFTKTLKNIGVAAEAPTPGTKFTLSGRDMGGEIEREISQLMARTQPKLILCILHGNSTEVYNSVKQACDVRLGVRNICVLADKLKAANDQYFANVGLKFNLKLGGANQSLRPTDLGIINEGKTMVVGVDVTHPSPGSTSSAPSVAGMVASIDSTLGQWPAEIKVQTARQEMVADLDGMLKKCLQRWANTGPAGGGGTGKPTTTKPYPENIIVYRDGVSEGQYDTVLDQELPLLKKACAETYPANMTKANLPRIAIIVVGKRHHTRFYPAQDAQADHGANTPNGTVVDRGVTEARNWDFFLQAHTAIKGTARPAHYFTVWDEIFQRRKPVVQQGSSFQNAADVLEDLTHRMCYLFGRATKAVSICPPAYYADLVCERARCYLSSVFDPSPEGSAASVSDHPGGGSGGAGGGGAGGAGTISVAIHPNVKDSMFYI